MAMSWGGGAQWFPVQNYQKNIHCQIEVGNPIEQNRFTYFHIITELILFFGTKYTKSIEYFLFYK